MQSERPEAVDRPHPIIEESSPLLKKMATLEELDVLRDTCRNLATLAMLEFMVSSGIRTRELCKLDIKDVDFEKRVADTGKRMVQFSDYACLLLRNYVFRSRRKKDEALFLNARGERITEEVVYYRIRTLGERGLGRPVSPRELRQ